MLKNLLDMTNLLKNAGQIGEHVNGLKDRLSQERVSGLAGGGLARAELNGLGDVLKITIDPQLLEQQDREMIETLVQSAVNEGVRKARQKHAHLLSELVSSLNLPIPGLEQILNGLTPVD